MTEDDEYGRTVERDPASRDATCGARRTATPRWRSRRLLVVLLASGALVAVVVATGLLRHNAERRPSADISAGRSTAGTARPAADRAVGSTAAPSVPAAAPRSTLYDPALRNIAMQLVSSAENSSLYWKAQYGYIEWDVEGVADENRGYTGGLIGFCSGCGDMTDLVRDYTTKAPGNVLARYLPALERQQELGMGAVTQDGLGPAFVRDWKAAAADPLFRQAQDHELDVTYYHPAVQRAIADGLHPLGQFIYYDAIVMHGPGDDPTSFGGIRAAALRRAAPPAQGGDEVTYLNAFLDAREAAMRTEQGHADTSRVDDEQRRFLTQGNLDLHLPLDWSTYGDRYHLPAS